MRDTLYQIIKQPISSFDKAKVRGPNTPYQRFEKSILKVPKTNIAHI